MTPQASSSVHTAAAAEAVKDKDEDPFISISALPCLVIDSG